MAERPLLPTRVRPPLITLSQFLALVIPLMVLAGVAFPLEIQKPGYLRLLWTEPMGLKMTFAAGAWMAIGLVAYLGGCMLMNSLGNEASRIRLTVWLGLGCFAIFCAPMIYVILVGPSAVQIQKNLETR